MFSYVSQIILSINRRQFGVHVLRAENGDLQPFKIFKNGLANSLSTEEGLATYMEEKFNTLDLNTLDCMPEELLLQVYL